MFSLSHLNLKAPDPDCKAGYPRSVCKNIGSSIRLAYNTKPSMVMMLVPAENVRSLSTRRSTIGCWVVSSRITNPARPKMQSTVNTRICVLPNQSLRWPVSRWGRG